MALPLIREVQEGERGEGDIGAANILQYYFGGSYVAEIWIKMGGRAKACNSHKYLPGN